MQHTTYLVNTLHTHGHSKAQGMRTKQREKKKTPRLHKQLAWRQEHGMGRHWLQNQSLESPPLESTHSQPPPRSLSRGKAEDGSKKKLLSLCKLEYICFRTPLSFPTDIFLLTVFEWYSSWQRAGSQDNTKTLNLEPSTHTGQSLVLSV